MSKPAPPNPPPRSGGAQRFRLVRYFLLTSVVMFAGVAGVLVHFVQRQSEFFHGVQESEALFFQRVQKAFAKEQDDASRRDLFQINEAAHVNITRLLANMLWAKDIAPFIERATQVPVDHCRAIADVADPKDGKAKPPAEKKACFAEAGRRIAELPGYEALNAKVFEAMKRSTVFKIKVFDLRGITIYSSERAQLGEDKAGNAGWRAAAAGTAASEMTHRNQFSAFEGVVENRDLISTYVPVRNPGTGTVVGVFEIYSDATPFVAQLAEATGRADGIAAKHRSTVERLVVDNRRKLEGNSREFLSVLYALLAALFLVLLAIVRNGQRIIDRQERARALAAERAQRAHGEKMAALSTMASGIAHEVGNPLTIIAGVAHEITESAHGDVPARQQARLILEQTSRISAMTREISEFASSRSDDPEWIDVNAVVGSICGFVRHDPRLSATRIVFEPGDALPAGRAIPSQLIQVLIDVLPRVAEASSPAGIVVATRAAGGNVRIEVRRRGAADAAPNAQPAPLVVEEFENDRERIAAMGGTLEAARDAVVITLQAAPPEIEQATDSGGVSA